MKFCVLSSDPLYKYFEKGEIKPRYWNPEEIFDEVCVFSFCQQDVEPAKVQQLVGRARLQIVPIGPPNPLKLYRQYRRVRQVVGDFQPDLIRVHNPWHAGVIGVRAARAVGVPALLSLHTHYGARRRLERRFLLQLLRIFERYSISRADQVLCVSHYLTDYARKMGAKSVEVIYNRVYTEQFGNGHPKKNKRPLILSVGRLDPPKDQACLVRSIQGLDVDLQLVGDGVNRPKLEKLVGQLGLEERVNFAGAVPHGNIQEYYARADLFAIATHYEGFCIPVLEAMAAGLPIVVSATEPLPEILGGAGKVVELGPEGFHQAFVELLGNPEEATGLSRAARKRAEGLDGALEDARTEALRQHPRPALELRLQHLGPGAALRRLSGLCAASL